MVTSKCLFWKLIWTTPPSDVHSSYKAFTKLHLPDRPNELKKSDRSFDKVITHPSLGLRFAFFRRTSGTYGYTSPRTHIAIFNPLSPYNLENAIWIVHPFSTMNYTKAQVKTTEAGSFAVHDGIPEIALDEEFCDVMINEEAMEYYLVTTKNNIYPFFLPDRARDPKVPRSPYIEQGMFHYANN